MVAASFGLIVTAQSFSISAAIDHRRDMSDDGFRDFVRRHEISQSLECLQQNNKAELRRRQARDVGTKRQFFICRCVEPFQLRRRQAGFEARIGGIAGLQISGPGR